MRPVCTASFIVRVFTLTNTEKLTKANKGNKIKEKIITGMSDLDQRTNIDRIGIVSTNFELNLHSSQRKALRKL